MELYRSVVSSVASMPNLKREYVVKEKQEDIPHIDGVKELAVSVALNRGVARDDLNDFFNPKISTYMPDPNLIPDLNESAEVILNAIHDGIKFGIVGDYDVDGATSVAEMVVFLKDAGVARELIEFYIPQRLSEGYGLNKKAVETLYDNGARLLLVLDSGTISNEPIAFARSIGMNVIVVDHHMPGEGWTKPEALIINPQLSEKSDKYKTLCTAGLVFVLLYKIRSLMNDINYPKIPSLIKLSGLGAVGTVADLMHLHGFNRALVAQGLPHLDDILGLSALTTKAMGKPDERKKIIANHLGFNIGPCINAGGRISDCMQGAELLTCESESEAIDRAENLFKINVDRQKIQREIEAEAVEMVSEMTDDGASVVILRNEDWHPGVIGIVASRILSHLNRPTIIIGGKGKGSGRSCHDFDLGTAVIEARELGLLTSGGGHAMACGVGVNPDKYEEFLSFMHEKSKNLVRLPRELDFEVSLADASVSLVNDLEALAPFGRGNENPVVLLKDCYITSIKYIGNPQNPGLRLNMECNGNRQGAVMWQSKGNKIAEYLSENALGKTVTLVVALSINDKYPPNPLDIRILDVVESV